MKDGATHPTREELEAGLDLIRRSPPDGGTLELIVRRPAKGEREVLAEGRLDLAEGLVGDDWLTRGSRHTEDGRAHPDMQINIMNARVIALVAQARDRWELAGDQLFVDLDLGTGNLPPGTRLSVGSALLEITAMPHLGCTKFKARFGLEAMRFVNSPVGQQLRMRGVNARVVGPGILRTGDLVRKV